MARNVGNSDGTNKAREKLIGPEAAIEAEIKFVKIALEMLFTNAVVSSQKEGLRIGDQSLKQRR